MSVYTLLNGYVGSKAPYISKIDAFFDKSCKKYIEPFAGGAAKYFSHYNGKYEKEWINEKNANIYILYKALLNEETREETMKGILALRKDDDKEIASAVFKNAQRWMIKPGTTLKNDLEPDKMVQHAINTYFVYSQSFNCTGRSYSSQKSCEKYVYETKRNLINAVERLKTNPKITCKDGLEIIKSHKDNPEIQMLIDWPYIGIYRSEPNLYGEEMSSLYSHYIGAEEIKNCKAAIVMCDYRCPYEGVPTIYDAILGDDWHCYKLADTYKKCNVVKHGETKQKASEYIWANRVPEQAGLYCSLVDYKENITIDEYWERIREACVNGTLPQKHIEEYETTYSKMYNGRQLLG